MSVATQSQKEQAKLTATYINGTAITVFALGCASPVLAGVDGGAELSGGALPSFAIATVCFAISFGMR